MKVCVTQLDGVNTMNALPLAAGQVVASARLDPAVRASVDFDIMVGNDPPERLVADMGGPDVLGLSLYLWNEQVSLAVARRARQAHPGCLVVAGGPSVPKRPEAAERYLRAHPQIDVLVRGEGEPAFSEIVRARLRGADLADLADIGGIAYRAPGGQPVVTPARPRVEELSDLASPYLDGTFERLQRRYPGRYPNWMAVGLIETNRGCPFRCTFCAAGLVEQNRVYDVPLERVFAELDWIVEQRFAYLFIADANFGIRPRDPRIVDYLVELKARTGLPSYCFFYMPKNAKEHHLGTVERLMGAGIGCQIALATQSFDPEVLAAVKRSNIPAERWTHLRDLCNQRGIRTYNELILGLPRQTLDSFTSTVARAVSRLPQDSFYLYLCRVIPNTDMDDPAYRQQFGLETRRCRAVPPDPRVVPVVDEYEEIVVGTTAMPIREWRRAFTLGYLVSATYNLRLLDVVIYYLQAALDTDLAAYFRDLCQGLRQAPEGSALADIQAVFDRYLASILDGGPVLLSVEGAGPTHREVGDAVVVAALRRFDELLVEVETLTRTHLERAGQRVVPAAETGADPVTEVFRFQRLVTPTFGVVDPLEERFYHDWLAFWSRQSSEPRPEPRTTHLRYEPPPYVGTGEFSRFVDTHLAALRAKADIGVVGPFP